MKSKSKSKSKNNKINNLFIHIFLVLVSFSMIVPFVWMFLTSFKTNTEATSVDPFIIFPANWFTDAYIRVLNNMNFVVLYKNTILMIIGRILFALVTASLAGYAFGRLHFKGKKLAFSLVLIQMMIPVQIFIIPQYVMISKIHATNSIFALLFPGLVTAFGTFLLTQSYKALPRDLEDAATIDGCNIFQTFLYVMAPLTRSALVALGIFTALFAYKDLMWPMIVNPSKEWMTLAPALSKMQGQYFTKFPELMAASLIASVPMIIIYLFFQKQFIEGIATSGGKL